MLNFPARIKSIISWYAYNLNIGRQYINLPLFELMIIVYRKKCKNIISYWMSMTKNNGLLNKKYIFRFFSINLANLRWLAMRKLSCEKKPEAIQNTFSLASLIANLSQNTELSYIFMLKLLYCELNINLLQKLDKVQLMIC